MELMFAYFAIAFLSVALMFLFVVMIAITASGAMAGLIEIRSQWREFKRKWNEE